MIGDSEVRPRLLRNPVYVGKVFFRGALHDGPHPHLVDEELFDRVQALLTERSEDYSKRASATSQFLLAGLVVCARCGKHFVGTSAVGNRYRYRYYTCFTRQRSGTRYCDVERLPAEEPDAAILDALLCTYERTDLFEKAVTDGAVPARKAPLQALVHEIRFEGRDRVVPWFRVPGGANPKVRALACSAPPAGLEPALPAPEAGALSAELRGHVAERSPVARIAAPATRDAACVATTIVLGAVGGGSRLSYPAACPRDPATTRLPSAGPGSREERRGVPTLSLRTRPWVGTCCRTPQRWRPTGTSLSVA